MDTDLLLELYQLCQQIINASQDSNYQHGKKNVSSDRKGARKKQKNMLKLYTFANLLLCGIGQNFRATGCPSQLDAERLLLIIGDLISTNYNAFMETLYDEMICGLKKFSVLSKTKLTKCFPYTLFVNAPQITTAKRGSFRTFMNRLFLVDYVMIYPMSVGLTSATKECKSKSHRIIRRVFKKRDLVLTITKTHKAQRSENSSRLVLY